MYASWVSVVVLALASLNYWFPLHHWDTKIGVVPSFVEAVRLLPRSEHAHRSVSVKVLVKLVPASD